MKIKKLFHWLYAILMLLPVFYIGGRVLYTIFNKNAKDSYSDYLSETIVKENNKLDLLIGTSYTLEVTSYSNTINSPSYYFSSSDYDFDTYFGTQNIDNFIVWIHSAGDRKFGTYLAGSSSITYGPALRGDLPNITFISTGQVQGTSNTTFYDLYSNKYVIGTLDNAFEYSVNQLNEVPLFSWAQNSFLNEPFTYISGLFGIAASNPINTMLSYWLSISIIWLVFDLVMYVPLLVHRWIDKGGID